VGALLLALAPPLLFSGSFRGHTSAVTVQSAREPSAAVVPPLNAILLPNFQTNRNLTTSTNPVTQARREFVFHRTGLCSMLGRNDGQGHFIAQHDLHYSGVDGDSLTAVVSRGAASSLAPEWAPSDLYNVRTMQPSTPERCEPPDGQCLRHDAAVALRQMLDGMRAANVSGAVHSAFRRYSTQCAVFRHWAESDTDGMCGAAKQSALAGHSQHQLGTTLDLFTHHWVASGPVFRPGFGCSPGGSWLRMHAREYGFVLSYPLHPDARDGSECVTKDDWHTIDPRSGYEYEPWHLRYVGPALTRQFEQAQQQALTQGEELTLDQWLRHQAGRPDDGDLPVCDGCSCGACSTLAVPESLSAGERAACDRDQMLAVNAAGLPVFSQLVPTITRAQLAGSVLDVVLDVPSGTVTQTPVPREELMVFSSSDPAGRWTYRRGAQPRAHRALPSAWRLAFAISENEPTGTEWHWQRGLSFGRAPAQYNGAVIYLPARTGTVRLRTQLPISTNDTRRVWVALLRDDQVFSQQMAR
jgi:D-alanyl-D-alanine carboxypeptidase